MKRFLVLALFVFLAGSAHAEVLYDVIDLAEVFEQVVPGAELIDTWGVRAIADDGTVLATGHSSDWKAKALFLWSESNGVTDLSSELSGTSNVTMNNSGIVVGNIHVDGKSLPYTWTSDGGLQLLPEPAGSDYTVAAAVNGAGTAVGKFVFPGSEPQESHPRAAMWRDGSYVDLGVFDGASRSSCNAINDRGQVVGSSGDGQSWAFAFIWDEESGMRHLCEEGIYASSASDINDGGQIVGFSRTYEGEFAHATLWENGTLVDIHTLSRGQSWANAINSSGQVLGEITLYTGIIAGTLLDGTPYEETIHDLFLWDEEHGMRLISDLIPADSDWTPRWAYDIGDDGTIVCMGEPDAGGVLRPYLLKPVPEPGTPLLVLLVAAAIGSRRGFRR